MLCVPTSWINKRTISNDPTPINPLALKLMNEDKNSCKVYIARPCQFISSSLCESKYWTSHRFSQEVINSYIESLEYLKDKYNNKHFTLIGYSGGAAVAAILSTQHSDVKRLITIAGNLDTLEWTSHHRISKLEYSLNPADYTSELENIEQYHLIGKKDKVIPKEIFLSYYSKFNNKDKIKYKYIDADHGCCWQEPYKNLLDEIQ